MKQRKSPIEHAAAVLASQRNQGLDSLAMTIGELESTREDLNITFFQVDKLMVEHLTEAQESLFLINLPPEFHRWRAQFGAKRPEPEVPEEAAAS